MILFSIVLPKSAAPPPPLSWLNNWLPWKPTYFWYGHQVVTPTLMWNVKYVKCEIWNVSSSCRWRQWWPWMDFLWETASHSLCQQRILHLGSVRVLCKQQNKKRTYWTHFNGNSLRWYTEQALHVPQLTAALADPPLSKREWWSHPQRRNQASPGPQMITTQVGF